MSSSTVSLGSSTTASHTIEDEDSSAIVNGKTVAQLLQDSQAGMSNDWKIQNLLAAFVFFTVVPPSSFVFTQHSILWTRPKSASMK